MWDGEASSSFAQGTQVHARKHIHKQTNTHTCTHARHTHLRGAVVPLVCTPRPPTPTGPAPIAAAAASAAARALMALLLVPEGGLCQRGFRAEVSQLRCREVATALGRVLQVEEGQEDMISWIPE